MAPLSKALAGILLPHDTFGNHLDSQNKTVDLDLEKRNLKKAGEVLAEIWGELVMDGHSVVAEFVSDKQKKETNLDHSWMAKHCRASQYMLQTSSVMTSFAVQKCAPHGKMYSPTASFHHQFRPVWRR